MKKHDRGMEDESTADHNFLEPNIIYAIESTSHCSSHVSGIKNVLLAIKHLAIFGVFIDNFTPVHV